MEKNAIFREALPGNEHPLLNATSAYLHVIRNYCFIACKNRLNLILNNASANCAALDKSIPITLFTQLPFVSGPTTSEL